MEHVKDRSSGDSPPRGEERENLAVQADRPGRPRRRRYVFLGIVAFCILVSLSITWSRWGQFDPNLGSQARERANIELSPEEHPLYYWMLLSHIAGASIALVAGVLQVWRGLRTRHPRVHRTVGRVYVFAGVVPATVLALLVTAFYPFSVATAFSQVALSLLWLGVTLFGLALRRQGRIAEHRRWMFRSYALTCSVLVVIAIDPFVQLLVSTQYHSRLNGNLDIYLQVKESNVNWLGLLISILIVEGYLEYERMRRPKRLIEPPAASGEQLPPAAQAAAPEPHESQAEREVEKTVSTP
ncbi:DUF2306 domain-containing protein [Micromonospora sp. RTGN7]|uniref:DUF2306 domain-containing protein n=1 Tax=Micromonospora sp. RTGN7 TaxID=3016526 RepID=UPI0029FEDE69|nr:DUF2306 domain-containing protein [Micromonospora sp. RTGN7]